MYGSVYDFMDFYNAPFGGTVRREISRHLVGWWGNVKGLRVVGIGYAQPYLDLFSADAERVIAISPAGQGGHPWPDPAHNLTAVAEESELPLETNSVDRVLLVHSLEYAELPRSNLQEIWRVLKSNGRLIIVVPNRRGLWARAEWSPFGHGAPYSGDQVRAFLRDHLFVCERSVSALYTPPLRWSVVRNASETIETYLPWILPGMGGLHIIEASKQIYGALGQKADARVIVRGRGLMGEKSPMPKPVPDIRNR